MVDQLATIRSTEEPQTAIIKEKVEEQIEMAKKLTILPTHDNGLILRRTSSYGSLVRNFHYFRKFIDIFKEKMNQTDTFYQHKTTREIGLQTNYKGSSENPAK